MGTSRLDLTRAQILAFRQRVGALDERLPEGAESLRQAAWAGLTDSMPRAALLSIHARVEGTGPETWEDPSLVQLWGPRYSVYVVAERDRAVFSLGTLTEDTNGLGRAVDLADRLDALLDGRKISFKEAGAALGEHYNRLKYAAPTGRVLIRWKGARAPVVWTVPPPQVASEEAHLELARRYLHVFGPGTPEAFAKWAGIAAARARATFEGLDKTAVRTPVGEGWILAEDESEFRTEPGPVAPARLLPSGDAYYLFWGDDRELLMPDADHRGALWTSRVWPGAVLVEGEIVGIWRRAQHNDDRNLAASFPCPARSGRAGSGVLAPSWDGQGDRRPLGRLTRPRPVPRVEVLTLSIPPPKVRTTTCTQGGGLDLVNTSAHGSHD